MSILKKVNDTFAKAGETGKNAAVTIQLKNDIRKLAKELDTFYAQLGRAYESNDAHGLELWLSKVSECKAAINQKEVEISELEPKVTVCESCGKEMAGNVKFCGSCGAKTVQVAVRNTCKGCGQVNDATVKFCLNCGERLLEE